MDNGQPISIMEKPIDVGDFLNSLDQKALCTNNNNKFAKNNKNVKLYTDNQTYIKGGQYKRIKEKYEDEETIKTSTEHDDACKLIIQEMKDQVKKKIENTKGIPIVMKLMLKMMLEERGHNHKKFRENVLKILQDNRCKVEDILNDSFKFKDWKYHGKYDKIKKLWARYLFDTYTMLCTKIANNFIRYDISQPEYYIKGTPYHQPKARMHVNKLGAIDVLNDKGKIINILRYFAHGKKYLAARGNLYLPGAPVPDKVEYGMLINDLNISISKFAGQLLDWRKNGLPGSEYLKTIMNEMDRELSDILKKVDVNLEKNKCSSTIGQPWNKACNLKKCVQFFYSKLKPGNNVITGQFFSGKNSRSGKKNTETFSMNVLQI